MASDPISTRHLHLSDLLGLLPWVPAGPVCDIGCGSGYLAAAVAAYGLPVTALDVDREILQQARQQYGEQVNWVHSDIRHYRLARESQAAIFCLNVFQAIPNGERARLIGRFKAAVKPGGFMVISGLAESDQAASQRLARSANGICLMPTGVFGLAELRERFRDWEILSCYQGPALHNEPKGSGLQQITQMIARKPIESKATDWKQLPRLGIGLDWPAAFQGLSQDFVELPVDPFLALEEDAFLAQLSQRMTLIPHSRELSLGSPGLRQDGYIESLARLIARCGSPWWCEHLAFTRSENSESYSLHAVPASEEALEVLKQNIRALRRQIPVPLLLEALPESPLDGPAEMDQATFLRHVAEEADCGLSLDAGRLWQQLQRQGQELSHWLERLPTERILQVRMNLGWCQAQDHAAIWELLGQLIQSCPIRAICLETGGATPEAQAAALARSRHLLTRGLA